MGPLCRKQIPKSFNNWFWLCLAIIWLKVVFYSPKPKEILSKYSKQSYFDIVEKVRGLAVGVIMAKIAKIAKNGQKMAKIQKWKKNIKFWLMLGICTPFGTKWLKKHTQTITLNMDIWKNCIFHGNCKMAIKQPNLVKTGQFLIHIPYFTLYFEIM